MFLLKFYVFFQSKSDVKSVESKKVGIEHHTTIALK